MSEATDLFRASRDQLLDWYGDHEAAVDGFRFPAMPSPFNWVCDWFDEVADGNDARALVVVEEDGSSTSHTFAELRERSRAVSAWLAGLGVRRGDSVIVMLGNRVELWESMLAIMRLGAVVMPTTTAVGPAELVDRIERGDARHVIVDAADVDKFDDVPGDYTRVSVGSVPVGGVAHVRGRVRRRRVGGRAPGHCARRPPAALLHVRHDQPPQARRAHPGLLSRGPPVDDVLAGREAGRRAPQHLLGRLGQARVVVLLRAVDRRGDDRGPQLRALRPADPAAAAAGAGGDDVLRAAHRVADAHQVRPVRWLRVVARADRCRRAAEPRGHRPGPAALGHDAARRLRPDGDDRRDREHAGVAR